MIKHQSQKFKIAIITRAINRLEYTVQCISHVKFNSQSECADYEHIIINNNSKDGTKEWLDWITKMPNNWYEKVKPVHLNDNSGDWGGMLKSLDYISDDVTHVMQLDNDIIVPYGWIDIVKSFYNETNADVVMLKRKGVDRVLNIKSKKQFVFDGNEIIYGAIPFAVACWVVDISRFRKYAKKHTHCRNFTQRFNVKKLWNVYCIQMEGKNLLKHYPNKYIQHIKYHPSIIGNK
jgi:glycosyltransferase involved in cell wall biosynthesis